ncbi:MAG: hypothetical protein ABFS41_01205 [Myxococcota bacterium]
MPRNIVLRGLLLGLSLLLPATAGAQDQELEDARKRTDDARTKMQSVQGDLGKAREERDTFSDIDQLIRDKDAQIARKQKQLAAMDRPLPGEELESYAANVAAGDWELEHDRLKDLRNQRWELVARKHRGKSDLKSRVKNLKRADKKVRREFAREAKQLRREMKRVHAAQRADARELHGAELLEAETKRRQAGKTYATRPMPQYIYGEKQVRNWRKGRYETVPQLEKVIHPNPEKVKRVEQEAKDLEREADRLQADADAKLRQTEQPLDDAEQELDQQIENAKKRRRGKR